MASPDPGTGASSSASAGPLVFLFNGDADGIVAQHILGMTLGAPDLRITGWKRDVHLLRKLPPLESARIHALDISLRQNLPELPALLSLGNTQVTWYDHHEPGDPPDHPRLKLHIHQAPGTCTAAIVHAVCGRAHPLWAAMAAFGDNVPVTARALAAEADASSSDIERLRKCGILINYNAYGEKPGDVLFEPADLAVRMSAFASALDFCREDGIFGPLETRFETDRSHFEGLRPLVDAPASRAFLVPDEPWARRFAATWANDRILAHPSEALAMIHPRANGTYSVSIRAPRRPEGAAADPSRPIPSAADLASEFPTGGGRKLAAGINVLPASDFERFLARFRVFFGE
jgi:hypothetical protein